MNKLAVTAVIGSLALAAAAIFAAPAIADDPGANPIGSWMCLATGATEPGQLTMTETAYDFAQPGAQVSGHGSYRIDRNVITVTSGPLKDDFGLGHGYFNTRASPIALTFDTSGGSMSCNPDIYL